MKSKFKTYAFWVALSGAVVLLVESVAEMLGFKIESSTIENVIMSICGVLVVLGIVTKSPQEAENKKEIAFTEEQDKIEEQISQNQTCAQEDDIEYQDTELENEIQDNEVEIQDNVTKEQNPAQDLIKSLTTCMQEFVDQMKQFVSNKDAENVKNTNIQQDFATDVEQNTEPEVFNESMFQEDDCVANTKTSETYEETYQFASNDNSQNDYKTNEITSNDGYDPLTQPYNC